MALVGGEYRLGKVLEVVQRLVGSVRGFLRDGKVRESQIAWW